MEAQTEHGSIDESATTSRRTPASDSRQTPASNSSRTLSRRRALGVGAVAGLSLLAGCTQDVGEEFFPNLEAPISSYVPDLPVHSSNDVLAAGIEDLRDADVDDLDSFVAAFDGYPLEVRSVERVAEVIDVEYVSRRRADEGILHDLGPIAGAYATLVEAGDESTALGITILDPGPASYGTAEVEAGWAEDFNAGDLTVKEYAELVHSTVASTRHRPEVEVEPEK